MNRTEAPTIFARAGASAAISYLVFEMLLRAFGGVHTASLWVVSGVGLAGLLFLRVQWSRGKLSRRSYLYMAGAIPFAVGMMTLYVYVQFV